MSHNVVLRITDAYEVLLQNTSNHCSFFDCFGCVYCTLAQFPRQAHSSVQCAFNFVHCTFAKISCMQWRTVLNQLPFLVICTVMNTTFLKKKPFVMSLLRF